MIPNPFNLLRMLISMPRLLRPFHCAFLAFAVTWPFFRFIQVTPQTHQFKIIDRDGIIVATSTGGPKYSGELFSYEKVLALHQDPNNDESMLFRPHPFLIGPDGYFYVLGSI